MLLQEPPESDYDLRFTVLGFPVRVSWTFWLGAVVFGHSLVQGIDLYATRLNLGSPGIAPLLVLWTLCLFVSILIHELGHALAFRQNGIHSSIVLYHFGGLAVPTGSFGGMSVNQISEKQDLWITFAGPLAQLVSAALVILVVKLSGYQVAAFEHMPVGLHKTPWMLEGKLLELESIGLYALVLFYVLPSVFWALLNLVPVWPLDGGRITRSLVRLCGGTTELSLYISIVAAGLLAAYAFRAERPIMAIFFLMFAFSNYQMLQQSGGWRY